MKSKLFSEIERSNSILLLTHESPDGDAIGSVLSIYNYLLSINKSVDMVILDIPKVFDFLPSIDKVVDNVTREYDLGIILDCASKERIGQKENLFNRCKKTICIDHHVSNNNYCDINIVEGNVSSCCQVIYYLFKEFNISLSNESLEPLICGVLTDTNGFSSNSVDYKTFDMASEMIQLGVNIHDFYDKLLNRKTKPQYELMKIGMNRLEFLHNGKIAFTYILKSDFDAVGAIIGEHEGIVDIGRSVDGVLVSVFLREDDGFTISLRSTGSVDVSKVALSIGGGGHFMAAGGKIYAPFEETKKIIIDKIEKVILE